VFSHFRKKLDILISVASFFRKLENELCLTFLIPSGTLSLMKYPVLIIKPNILLLLYWSFLSSFLNANMQNNNKTSRVNLLFPFFKFRAESICCSVERTLLVTFMSSNLWVDRVYLWLIEKSVKNIICNLQNI
jgi:hypothetical protein